MRNPFEFGRALSADEMVDRQLEVSAVADALTGASKLFLIGPRRYGKTSILRVAGGRAEDSGAVVLRYDAEAYPTLSQLTERLLADAVRHLTPTIEKAGGIIRDVFARLRPQMSVDPQTNTWTVSLAAVDVRAQLPLLVDVLDGIERLATDAHRPVAIVIDEFQKIVEEGGHSAEAQIRAAVQHHSHVSYVFAGSKTRLLADMTSDPNRPFYKLGQVLFLGPVPRQDFVAFLNSGFADGGIVVEQGAAEAILDAAEEVPYNVQLLAHTCWDMCREVPRKGVSGSPRESKHKRMSLSPEFVWRTRDAVALRADPIYTQLWSGLPSTQQRALLALLRDQGEGLTSTAVASRYKIPISTLDKSLKLLEKKGIIREEQARGATQLRFEDPFFGAWIQLIVPGRI